MTVATFEHFVHFGTHVARAMVTAALVKKSENAGNPMSSL